MRKILSRRVIAAALLLLTLLALLVYCACKPNAKERLASLFRAEDQPVAAYLPQETPAAAQGETAIPVRGLAVYIIDVGQGSAALVISPSGKSLLIDAGEKEYAPAVRSLLRKQGIERLDLVALSHLHSDHVGAMPPVLRAYPAASCIMPPCDLSADTELGEALRKAGTQIFVCTADTQPLWDDEVQLRVLSPAPGVTYPDENQGSLMLHIRYGNTAVLFAADAGAFAEDTLLQIFPKETLHAQLLVAGHHGSSSATTPRFLRAVSPECAVISCGAGNAYGHPHQSVLNLFEKQGVQVLRTDQNGVCAFYLDGDTLTFNTTR